jgi:hypothetical protein
MIQETIVTSPLRATPLIGTQSGAVAKLLNGLGSASENRVS